VTHDIQIRRGPPIERLKSIHALRFWEFPFAAQDFGARAIESHYVIPTRHSRQTIRNLAAAAAELNRDRAVRVFLGGDVVQRVCSPIAVVGLGLGRRTIPEMIEYSVVTAVYTMWLAARAEGIGFGWVSILDPARMAEIPDVPPDWHLIGD
jgi:nitroreductase